MALVEVGDRALQVRVEELSAEEAAAFWPRVLQIAPDYAKYPRRTSRRIPMVRLVPIGRAERKRRAGLDGDSRMGERSGCEA